MFSSDNENDLIVTDVVQTLLDCVGIQQDINDVKCKASWLLAQEIDAERVLNEDVFARCREPQNDADNKLKRLVLKMLSFYTYSRLLKGNQGTFTDGGYQIEKEATDGKTTLATANYHYSVADVYLTKVLDFLKLETPDLDQTQVKAKMVPRIRKFGGRESRGSN